MPQDLSAKRRRLAENAVIHAGRLYEAALALEALKVEAGRVGNFTETELSDTSEGFDLRHLTPFLVGLLTGQITASLTAWLDADSGGGYVPRNVLIEAKR